MKNEIREAIKDIERWAGEAYTTPSDPRTPDGDEIYQALQKIKKAIDKGCVCETCGKTIKGDRK